MHNNLKDPEICVHPFTRYSDWDVVKRTPKEKHFSCPNCGYIEVEEIVSSSNSASGPAPESAPSSHQEEKPNSNRPNINLSNEDELVMKEVELKNQEAKAQLIEKEKKHSPKLAMASPSAGGISSGGSGSGS